MYYMYMPVLEFFYFDISHQWGKRGYILYILQDDERTQVKPVCI